MQARSMQEGRVMDAVTCADARRLASAAVDDELTPDEARRLGDHLDGCAACTRYADDLAGLTRRLRLRPVAARDDRTASILARARPPRLGRGGWMRPALAWVGLVVAAQSVGPLVLGDLDGTPTHVARHVGASALALAIGLLYAAWRPVRAFGLLPLVAALFAATVAAAVLDTVAGDRTAVAETIHVAELIGMVLLWLVAGSPGWERARDAIRTIRSGGGVPHTTS
jgi:predicted anti-sigma-YlaC factor YlaD